MLQMKQDGWETDGSVILPCKSKWVSFQSHHGHETQRRKCTLIAICQGLKESLLVYELAISFHAI